MINVSYFSARYAFYLKGENIISVIYLYSYSVECCGHSNVSTMLLKITPKTACQNLDMLLKADSVKLSYHYEPKMLLLPYSWSISVCISGWTQEIHWRHCDTLFPKGNYPMTLINQSHWSDVTCSLFSHKECKQSRWYLGATYSH